MENSVEIYIYRLNTFLMNYHDNIFGSGCICSRCDGKKKEDNIGCLGSSTTVGWDPTRWFISRIWDEVIIICILAEK